MWLRIAPTEVEQNRKETGDGPSVPTYGAVQLERASSLIPEKPNNPSFWPLKCTFTCWKKKVKYKSRAPELGTPLDVCLPA